MSGPFGGAAARNFGWGKNLGFAGSQALRARFGGGHFSSQDTHATRWDQAVAFFMAQGIRDARAIDQEALETYATEVAERVADELIGVRYAQNLLSTANVVISALRGDDQIYVSPRAWVGTRTQARTTVPDGMELSQVAACAANLRAVGMLRAAAAVGLARTLGMRLREAILADLPRLSREAAERGQINVQDGAKGGRSAPRWVPATPAAIDALQEAIRVAPNGSRNLLAAAESLTDLYDGEMRSARKILKDHEIKGFHELRAAYACSRYHDVCGVEATVIAGRNADRDRDNTARELIAAELGHGRIDVVASYVGGRRDA